MRRRPGIAIAVVAVVAALLIVGQLLVPGLVERRVADRLTAGGGEAEVSVSAFPAARLLFDDGARFAATGSGLDLDLAERVEVFDRLDGFGEVELVIADSVAGPFAIERFALTRSGGGPYRLVSESTASPAELVDFGADQIGLPGGELLGDIAGGALGDRPVPVELDMELVSADGEVDVTSGGGTVAGLPTGPLGELITTAIVSQL